MGGMEQVSQGSVATCLMRYGGIFSNNLIADLLVSVSVNEIR